MRNCIIIHVKIHVKIHLCHQPITISETNFADQQPLAWSPKEVRSHFMMPTFWGSPLPLGLFLINMVLFELRGSQNNFLFIFENVEILRVFLKSRF